MNTTQLTFAFTAGLVATINPCGFAMLPAYLSYFLGLDRRAGEEGARAGIWRALLTGFTVSAGFLVVFGIVGLLVTAGLTAINNVVPWVTIGIGIALVALGVAFLSGWQMTAFIPKFDRGGAGRDSRSLFLFGISYAVASVSCGLPTFIVVVSTSVNDFGSGLVAFGVYAAGMSLVLTSLTISLAMARRSLLTRLRSLMRYTDQLAGVLMVLAGAYLIFYWLSDRLEWSGLGIVLNVERWSGDLTNFVAEIGGLRLGLILSVALSLGLMVALADIGGSAGSSDSGATGAGSGDSGTASGAGSSDSESGATGDRADDSDGSATGDSSPTTGEPVPVGAASSAGSSTSGGTASSSDTSGAGTSGASTSEN